MTKTVLKKDKTVQVKTKAGGSYSYSYSTLAEIHRYLEETGQRYEAFIKKVEGEDYMFIRKLSKDDDTIVELQGAKIPPVTGVQDYGGVLTSVRRFSLLMAYGLACEDEEPKPAPTAQEKWKSVHTPDPNKPATAKQLKAINTLCEDLGIPPRVAYSEYFQPAQKNQAEASKIIKKLIDMKESNGNAEN